MGYFGNFVALAPDYQDSDLLITHGDSLLMALKGIPVIRVMHGSALGEMLSAKTPWRFFMQFGVYLQELLTALFYSGCVANSYNATRYNPLVRRVIPLGINLTDFYPDPDQKTPTPSILFVGTLDGRKRGQKLVEWFCEAIRPKHPEATLDIVGPRGPEVAGVTYYTGIATSELALLYRRAWVYASPSTYEGFGLPYVEAMASGTPVVASPNPGSREILDGGRYGRLADDSQFSEAIVELLSNARARNDLGARGLARSKNYSLAQMLDSYENLAFELCGHRDRNPSA
jgi:phosphatidyl-myo-inositol alpha-mannosyltransferase